MKTLTLNKSSKIAPTKNQTKILQLRKDFTPLRLTPYQGMSKFYKKKPPHTHGLLYIVIFLLLLCSLCAVSISFYCNHKKWKTKKLSQEMKDKEPSDDKLLTTFYYMNQFGNIREFPQAVGIARELQKAETIFLKEIVKVFEKHGIRYWLDGDLFHGMMISILELCVKIMKNCKKFSVKHLTMIQIFILFKAYLGKSSIKEQSYS